MSEPTFDAKQKAKVDDLPARESVALKAENESYQTLYDRAIGLLKSRRNLDQIPMLVGNLDNLHRAAFSNELDALAAVASGDIVLATAEALATARIDALRLALGAHKPATRPVLVRYLRDFPVFEYEALVSIGEMLRAQVGGNLVEVLPPITLALPYITGDADLVRWFVETTPSAA